MTADMRQRQEQERRERRKEQDDILLRLGNKEITDREIMLELMRAQFHFSDRFGDFEAVILDRLESGDERMTALERRQNCPLEATLASNHKIRPEDFATRLMAHVVAHDQQPPSRSWGQAVGVFIEGCFSTAGRTVTTVFIGLVIVSLLMGIFTMAVRGITGLDFQFAPLRPNTVQPSAALDNNPHNTASPVTHNTSPPVANNP